MNENNRMSGISNTEGIPWKLMCALIMLFYLSTIFTQHLLVNKYSRAMYIFPILVILTSGTIWIYNNQMVSFPKQVLIPLSVVYVIYIIHVVSDPNNLELVSRVFIFIPISAICIFVVPYIMHRTIFLKFLSISATVVALLGIPAAFFGEYLHIITTHSDATLVGFRFNIINSIFSNPNGLAEFLFLGIISSLVWEDERRILYFTVITCVTGLILTQSRAGFLAALVAAGFYLTGQTFGYRVLKGISLISFTTGLLGYLMLLRLLPAPTLIEEVYLSGRLQIWHAAMDAVAARPLFGHGPGDMPTIVGEFTDITVGAGVYNSFLRLFVTTGIVGGLAYLYMFTYVLTQHVKVISDRQSIIIYTMLVGFIVNELFSGNSIFGLSTFSVLGSTIIGYSLLEITISSHREKKSNFR